jgi:hypothetical protein
MPLYAEGAEKHFKALGTLGARGKEEGCRGGFKTLPYKYREHAEAFLEATLKGTE